MLLVKTRIGPSALHGIGLFAAESIPAGAVIWQYHEGFDKAFAKDNIAGLPPTAQAQLLNYTYIDPENGMVVLCADDARFFNHSTDSNTRCTWLTSKYGETVAARDIAPGEEITCDYYNSDADGRRKLGADAR